MGMIKESFVLSATDADILAAPSRLAAIPRNGVLTIEATASDSDATNFGQLTLQLPDGIIPFEDLVIGASAGGADNQMNLDTKFMVTMAVAQGGHVGLSYVENGTVALFFLHVTLIF